MQARGAQWGDQIEIKNVELHLAVEGLDRGVEVVAVAGPVVVEGGERFGEQLGHQVGDALLDRVHLGVAAEPDAVVLHASLLETLEGGEHIGAVIGLVVVLAHRHG